MAHSTCDLEMGMGRLVTLSHEACSEPLQILSHEACSEPLQIFSAKYSYPSATRVLLFRVATNFGNDAG
jgi:hypothetical protein